jgi:hypothetical protein
MQPQIFSSRRCCFWDDGFGNITYQLFLVGSDIDIFSATLTLLYPASRPGAMPPLLLLKPDFL